MTDTEAKALALVNETSNVRQHLFQRDSSSLHEALCRAIERLEATEARHAAELREQAERFSEVLAAIRRKTVPLRHHDTFDELAAPFILPAPDPLESVVEQVALDLGITGASSLHTVRADDFRRKLIAALRAQQKDTNA